MTDRLFFQHFRLTKATVLLVLHQIEHRLEYLHNLNNSVLPINQLLICLRFYATGCHQLSLAYFGGMHKSTVNRIIKRVTEALCHLAPQYIKISGVEDRQTIDCTHIKIQLPGGNDAELFRNRKWYFSLNVPIGSQTASC